MNYTEYTLFFFWFMWVTEGEPLDKESWTLSGSLDADGVVLSGDWGGDRFRVGWCNRDGSHDSLRFRQVVLPSLS